jgi:uncharacterized protein YecE (DUF72 family)
MIKNMQWFIGCSGFHYKEWKGKFYPEKLPQTKWFDFYCKHFSTLELNVTFYRFPTIGFLENWYAKSPDDFLFSVKAPRLITHYKRFENIEAELNGFYETLKAGLKNKLGCILFQLPARFEFSDHRLNQIIDAVNDSFDNVLEFRNVSWWNEKVFTAFKKKRIAFCGVSLYKLPEEPVIISDIAYYRFHGVPKLYYSPYKEEDLMKVANAITSSNQIKKAFVYFNLMGSIPRSSASPFELFDLARQLLWRCILALKKYRNS